MGGKATGYTHSNMPFSQNPSNKQTISALEKNNNNNNKRSTSTFVLIKSIKELHVNLNDGLNDSIIA